MSIKVIACEVMKEELLSIKPKAAIDFEFISMGLHLYPNKLQKEIQSILDKSLNYSRIILAFGLCGGSIKNVKVKNSILTIPKVHDCIPILLGSKEKYYKLKDEEKGTFYLSGGWMLTEKSILSEHKRICERFGERKALKVIDKMYNNYKRVLFINTSRDCDLQIKEQSKEIARLLKVNYETIDGTNNFLEKIVLGPWDQGDFINIPPFGTVTEEDFGIGERISD
ncbi:DUF1638 domain-containing protein [Clostridium cellulovorans]|uniref:DUF1638 domain-containing protein n=1 Tax=Clostridium cellulovorans (strain ATCC 35296 / DSM 3052 / OCM 3 / 743B) TaxID=573061 RepID=D9SUU7_CLOC7|nr:DUF1638 domain-containing protein [Clostridium cellulovorans]ADL51002.1 protein of unknown function DUF1638 [Clostridium cellulovorans 743B]